MISTINIFKCLGDETRLRSMVLLNKEGRLCVREITEALGLSQPKISRHLALLRQYQLLLDARDGQWVYYSLNPNLPSWLSSVLEIQSFDLNLQAILEQDNARLQNMLNRPSVANPEKDSQ